MVERLLWALALPALASCWLMRDSGVGGSRTFCRAARQLTNLAFQQPKLLQGFDPDSGEFLAATPIPLYDIRYPVPGARIQ